MTTTGKLPVPLPFRLRRLTTEQELLEGKGKPEPAPEILPVAGRPPPMESLGAAAVVEEVPLPDGIAKAIERDLSKSAQYYIADVLKQVDDMVDAGQITTQDRKLAQDRLKQDQASINGIKFVEKRDWEARLLFALSRLRDMAQWVGRSLFSRRPY